MASPVMNEFQPSLTEWVQSLGRDPAWTLALREEDGKNAERLETLYQAIGLPYERPEFFDPQDLLTPSAEFLERLNTRGDQLCAIRLVPKDSSLPKLRQRGLSLRTTYENWFLKQTFDPSLYTVHVCPHSETLLWSAIFVVRPEGILGEITRGMHSQLTHGETSRETCRGSFDFSQWKWSCKDEEAEHQLKRMVRMIHVVDRPSRQMLEQSLQATFSREYLQGYFEATIWPGDKVLFIDYNRVLPQSIDWKELELPTASPELLQGVGASSGRAQGRVRLMTPERLLREPSAFRAGDILVCENTDVRYVPLMIRAAAIVTDMGGMLSHASIVSRELRKPSIVGTRSATKVLKEEDLVEVDAEKGTVRVVERARGSG